MIRVLQSRTELQESRERLRRRGLDFTDPKKAAFWRALYHLRFRAPLAVADLLKSWDVALAAEVIEREFPDRLAPVLDMGCYNSEILYVLHELGYRRLHGCDLNPLCRWMPYWHRIRYRLADLTRTPYGDKTFAAITCLSVIEHGVNPDSFAAEVSRLLRPGGLLLLTTDFDGRATPHAIPTDQRFFGAPWRIASGAELMATIARFEGRGFTLLEPGTEPRTPDDCPITWGGENYTFAFVALRAEKS
jgi:SAM-dependent methyltransferase